MFWLDFERRTWRIDLMITVNLDLAGVVGLPRTALTERRENRITLFALIDFDSMVASVLLKQHFGTYITKVQAAGQHRTGLPHASSTFRWADNGRIDWR